MVQQLSLKWFLYTLYCEDDKYYVGICYDILKRLKQHFKKAKQGAVFTKIYQPIKCLELLELPTESWDEAEIYENYKTIEYAKKFGTGNVAGGNFTTRDYNNRKRSIDNVVKKNKINIRDKEYSLSDETILLKLNQSKIIELFGLKPENINCDNIDKIGISIPSSFQYLSFEKVSTMIEHINCLKDKLIIAISLIYNSKISRISKIKFIDIDRENMTINIPRKGNKSSTSILEKGLLDLIENYYRAEKIKPKEYLFGTQPRYNADVEITLKAIKISAFTPQIQ